jgi:hypothetical protein
MKVLNKSNLISFFVVLFILILVIVIFSFKDNGNVEESVVRCIGENSELYVQLGCHACLMQEKIFGENQKYLNKIDCFYEEDKCLGIEYTPSWIIEGEVYRGVQSLEDLRKFTNC